MTKSFIWKNELLVTGTTFLCGKDHMQTNVLVCYVLCQLCGYMLLRSLQVCLFLSTFFCVGMSFVYSDMVAIVASRQQRQSVHTKILLCKHLWLE